MTGLKRILTFLIIFSIILATLINLQQEIDEKKGGIKKIERFMYLPEGIYLKTFSLGFDQVMADIIWLSVIQVVGEKKISEEGYEWIYHALEVVTTLDRKFDYAYQFGGIILSTLGDKIEMSNNLLEKGLKENPSVWQIPFYLGFNHFFYMDDYSKAAEYISLASKLPGHPAYLPLLAARLFVQAQSPDIALEFLARMHSEAKDEKVRMEIEERAKEVIVERDIQFLEAGIKRYIATYKRDPEGVEDLVTGGVINIIPKEPFGGYYYIDKATKEVKSSMKKERLRLHVKPKAR